jgi:hypothetical protein
LSGVSPDWFPDWSGETAVIVASGPSAKEVPLSLARGRAKVITINESWRLAPWADVLYAADHQWWQKGKGVPEFRGLRVAQGDAAPRMYPRIKEVGLVRTGQIVRSPLGYLAAGSDEYGRGANSGFQALNLAVQFGATRIVLVGYDMRVDQGFHWHGRHPQGMNNPTPEGIARWARVFDQAAGFLRLIGVEVLNASASSALTAYPKVDFEDLFCTSTNCAAPSTKNITAPMRQAGIG